MSATILTPVTEHCANDSQNSPRSAGHPLALRTLFLIEMWERFSYYGMKAILVLYLTAQVTAGGQGFTTAKAFYIYGLYTSAVYFTQVFGGFMADRLLGARRAVLYGGIVIACGHFTLAWQSLPLFYTGLVLICVGTGLLKPNISVMVGSLYAVDDPRRDSGFSIFYMGINLGAMIAPLVCGYLGQRIGWHIGFAAAGVGMVLGLIQFTVHRQRLSQIGERPKKAALPLSPEVTQMPLALTKQEKSNLVLVFLLYFFSMLFWMVAEQAGSSFTLFAEKHTRNVIFGWEFPSSWFQSVNSFFILALAPIFSWLWSRLGTHQPASSTKFSLGLLLGSLGMFILAYGSLFIGSGPVSPLWLIAVYFLHTVGELCLSPVGLSTVTKLSPLRLAGLMMGLWFVASALGNYLAAIAAGFYQDNSLVLFRLFGTLGLITIAGSAFLILLRPTIQKLTK